jgi:branched-subunit amino acid transport protein AzlD
MWSSVRKNCLVTTLGWEGRSSTRVWRIICFDINRTSLVNRILVQHMPAEILTDLYIAYCYCYRVVSLGVPCTATVTNLLCVNVWVKNHFWLIHQSSLTITSGLLVAKQKKLSEEWQWIFTTMYFFHAPQGSLTCLKILYTIDGITFLRRKSCYGFLSSFKMYPAGFEPANCGSKGNTINTRPPTFTTWRCREEYEH